jgi:Protein of unknown function (DUF1592)/Protein of unknown function (DUF1588)/Protein of unknown function (DUF1587)/Protein of unknown function (DUF1585)/Protein of unknown function (DUF1595)/Planctomycete cytochrome C
MRVLHRLSIPPFAFAFFASGIVHSDGFDGQAFLNRHCTECHGKTTQERELDLSMLSMDAADASAHKKWVHVFDRVKAGEMPPKDADKPNDDEIQRFLASLGNDLTQKHAAQKGTVLRRINRREYQNTINELLGIQVNVVDLLPEDGRAAGFDNIGEALSISGVQMQRYIEAAELALDAALNQLERPESTTETFAMDGGRNAEFLSTHWLKRDDGSVVVFNEGGFPATRIQNLRVKHPGKYKLRISGYGYQIDEKVVFAVIAGSFDRGGGATIRSYHELPIGTTGTIETTLALEPGDGIRISPQGLNGPDGHSPVKDGPANYPGEGMAFQDIELEGPLVEEWPSRGRQLLLRDAKVSEVIPEKTWLRTKRGYKPIFKAESEDPQGDSRRNLAAFLASAFRRPLTAKDIEPYAKLFDDEYSVSHDLMTAMRTAAIAALCSPEFLFLREDAGQLNQQQLASRLSYFLARSAPDAQLRSADILNPSILRAETERLLQSGAFDRFIADFTDGWLNLREIEFTTPDKLLYPEYDGLLLDSMLRETRTFVKDLIESNLSVTNLIDSDYAMLNSRLARHYGIADVTGLDIRKVALPPDSKRGGILTQASILKVSANGTNTSPVVRGVWVIDRMLGLKPSPPPAGIPGVEPDIRGATTLREQLDKHRNMETCNTCHRVIDPPGFALENYDVIGGWRDRFRSLENGEQVKATVQGRKVRYRLGPHVDASGTLSNGEKFEDLNGLQKLMLLDRDRVAQNILEKLLTFATGREMGFSDRAEIESMVQVSKNNGHRLRDLIHTIVQSSIFRSK